MLPGVYLAAGTALTWQSWAHIAVLAAGPDAVLIGVTAAQLRRWVPPSLPITIAIPHHRRFRIRSDAIHVLRLDVPDADCVTVDGLPTTTRLRTAVDVAHLLPLVQAQPIIDRMLVLDKVDLDELTAAIGASRRRGSAQARALKRYKIAVEVKGWLFHSKHDRAKGDDDRITDLQLAGWFVVPVGWLELMTDPAGVVAKVRAAIAARAASAA